MELQVTALLFLIGAIILGFVKKINVGLVCLGFSLILGTIGGMGAGDIYKGFPYKLFATLLGTMLFFQSAAAKRDIGKNISEVDWNMRQKNIFSSGYHLCSQLRFICSRTWRYQCSVCYSAVCSIYGSPNENKPGTYGNYGNSGSCRRNGITNCSDWYYCRRFDGRDGDPGLGISDFSWGSCIEFDLCCSNVFSVGGYKLRGTAEKSEKKTEKMDRNQWLSLSALFIRVTWL